MFQHFAYILAVVVASMAVAPASAQGTSAPIRIVSTFPKDSPVGMAVERLTSRLNERLGGRFQAIIVPPDGPALAMLTGNRAEMAVTPTADLREVTRDAFALYDLPFLFATTKEVAAVQQTSAGSVPLAALERSGLVGLTYLNNGINSLLTKSVPTGLDNFQGQKIRVANQSGGSAISQLGAKPVVLPFGEISAALTAGAVDGLETSNRLAAQLSPPDRPSPFAAATPIRPSVSTLMMTEAIWRKLPYRAQSIIAEESEKASLLATEIAFQQDNESLKSLSARNSITQVSSQTFAKAIQPVWNRAKGVNAIEINNTVLPVIEEVRRVTAPSQPAPDRRGSLSEPPVRAASTVGSRGIQPGEVLFATDRAFEADPEPRYRLAGRRGELTFGLASFSINPSRRMGATDDGLAPMTGVALLKSADFESKLSAALQAASKKEIVIFVHGFNNAFDSASRALALINSDIHFGGVPILFSWPSDGAATRYGSDEEEVRASRDNFLRFVEKVRQVSGLERLHVAAHSMGNRLVLEAIDRFDGTSPNKEVKLFYHAVMAAPDVYVSIFEPTASAFQRRTARVTIYASDKDTALLCSRTVHGGNRRLGEAGPGIFVKAGVETIDATEAEPVPSILSVDAWPALSWVVKPCNKGHGYMMRSVRIQADLQNLILTDLPPASRPGLETKAKDGINYWAFRPTD